MSETIPLTDYAAAFVNKLRLRQQPSQGAGVDAVGNSSSLKLNVSLRLLLLLDHDHAPWGLPRALCVHSRAHAQVAPPQLMPQPWHSLGNLAHYSMPRRPS